jgi:hypothetical protein
MTFDCVLIFDVRDNYYVAYIEIIVRKYLKVFKMNAVKHQMSRESPALETRLPVEYFFVST